MQAGRNVRENTQTSSSTLNTPGFHHTHFKEYKKKYPDKEEKPTHKSQSNNHKTSNTPQGKPAKQIRKEI